MKLLKITFTLCLVATTLLSNPAEKACADGDGRSCLLAGQMLVKSKHYTKASKYYYRGCFETLGMTKSGRPIFNFKSCASLGNLYKKGLGVKKDVQEAQMLFELACASRSDRSGCPLARAYGYAPKSKRRSRLSAR